MSAEPIAPEGSESLLALVRESLLEKRTGKLVVQVGPAERVFFFVSGDLYLDPGHALAQHAEGRGTPKDPFDEAWLDQVLAYFDALGVVEYRFEESTEGISTDLFGPIAAAPLVMRGAVRDQDEFHLLRLLGGEDQLLVAVDDEEAIHRVSLDPQEAFFLSRLEQPTAVRDVLRQSELPVIEAAQRLCRLYAVRLIKPFEGMKPDPKSKLLDARLLDRFQQRIGADLDRQPMDLDSERHRQRLASLIARLGGLNYYELLGIGPGAGADEVHDAYTRLARIVHPRHAERLGLRGKEAGIELLFERATEAYLTLSDEDRRGRYMQEVVTSDGTIFAVDEEKRRSEVEGIAEHNYKMAKQLVLRQDYFSAIELLHQAVRMEARPDYYGLLGECQAQNPQWLDKAIDSFSRAVQLAPEDPDLRVSLGAVFAQAGQKARARTEFQAALKVAPDHGEARSRLESLDRAHQPAEPDGWLAKLKQKLGQR